MIKKGVLVTLFFLVFSVAVVQAIGKGQQNTDSVQSESTAITDVSIKAPNFTLTTPEGKKVNLADYQGKKVILNFWATWCPPCKAEMPALQDLYERLNGHIEILAINIDPENDVSKFVKKHKLTFPILLDQTGKVNESYSILSVPTTFLLDENGTIIKKQIGAMTLEQMEAFIAT